MANNPVVGQDKKINENVGQNGYPNIEVKDSKLVCPYIKTRPLSVVSYTNIEERFDFQFAENGKVEIVSIGKVDTTKEIDSHKDQVGLINAIKLAMAKGIDTDTFAKKEPGLMIIPEEIETVDDLIQAQNKYEARLDEMAKQLGISTAELIAAVRDGTLSKFEKKAEEQPEQKENK